ncbi:hypothetical protein VIGAN_08302600, partial [Vigna angularis var. angularis]
HLYLQNFRLFFFPPKFPTPFLLSKFRNRSSLLKLLIIIALSFFLSFFVLPFRSLRVFSFDSSNELQWKLVQAAITVDSSSDVQSSYSPVIV